MVEVEETLISRADESGDTGEDQTSWIALGVGEDMRHTQNFGCVCLLEKHKDAHWDS